ncbi:endonuclease domain-containing protein [Lysinibacillus sp. NPDC097162]|uniref:endonuclease domain-containing protein n=1 Tax=Lysinibacillus sp. NPDC097162 TaxID=3364140 RepID=UPI0038210723
MGRRKTHEEFVAEVKALVGEEYTIKTKYIGVKTPLLMKHISCGETYQTTPNNFKKGSRCPKCAIESMRSKLTKAHSQFVKELHTVDDSYELLTEYTCVTEKVLCKCRNCGEKWRVLPSNLLAGTACPYCNASKGEKLIKAWLIRNKILHFTQYPIRPKQTIRNYRLDFFVNGIAIEYDGEQHFKSVEIFGGEIGLAETQSRDRIKNKYCADNGIPLIRIPYWDYENIDAILTEKLLPLLYDANLTQDKAS